MDELMQEFLAETSESLTILDGELVKFEQSPDDAEILMNIFRLMHTIKGTCGFLGLARLEKVAHAGEDVLGKFRDGELTVTPDAVSLILACIDRIREMLAAIADTGQEAEGDDSELIARLKAMAAGETAKPSASQQKKNKTATPEAKAPEAAASPEDEPVVTDQGFPVAAELLAEVEEALAGGDSGAAADPMPVECQEDDCGGDDAGAEAGQAVSAVTTAAGQEDTPPTQGANKGRPRGQQEVRAAARRTAARAPPTRRSE